MTTILLALAVVLLLSCAGHLGGIARTSRETADHLRRLRELADDTYDEGETA